MNTLVLTLAKTKFKMNTEQFLESTEYFFLMAVPKLLPITPTMKMDTLLM